VKFQASACAHSWQSTSTAGIATACEFGRTAA
jgi:hypothetical protein